MSIQQDIMRLAKEFAEACADCEHWRTADAYPFAQHAAAWERRLSLQYDLLQAAKRLSSRPTEPRPAHQKDQQP